MLTTSATYRLIASDIDRSLARTRAEPPVALETRYYLDHIGAVKDIDGLVKDHRLFTYAMKAFGLEDMGGARAFMRKILSEGINDPKSFANRLADSRFIEFARVFNFDSLGPFTTQMPAARDGVVDRYIRQTLETEAGAENEGVRLALYFERKAPTVASAYGLLADPALWQVLKTTFGFPSEMANAAIDKQADAVLARLSLADLKDPVKLERLIQRFAAAWDATTAAAQDPVLMLFSNQPAAQTDTDLIMTVTSLKHGGP
jgi:hypothetical protein